MASHSPLNRSLRTIEQYVALEPPTTQLIEDAEAGLTVPYEDRWPTEIYAWFSSGRTLVSWCQLPGRPARSLVLRWIQDPEITYDLLRDRFRMGLINRAFALVDDAGSVADEPLPFNSKGGVDVGAMADKKVRLDSRLQLAALFDPLRYAPLSKTALQARVTQNITVNQQNVVNLTDEQLTAIIAESERRRLRAATPGTALVPVQRGSV